MNGKSGSAVVWPAVAAGVGGASIFGIYNLGDRRIGLVAQEIADVLAEALPGTTSVDFTRGETVRQTVHFPAMFFRPQPMRALSASEARRAAVALSSLARYPFMVVAFVNLKAQCIACDGVVVQN